MENSQSKEEFNVHNLARFSYFKEEKGINTWEIVVTHF